MSRVGKKPVDIPSGVTVQVNGSDVVVKGGKGELSYSLPDGVSVSVDDKLVEVTRKDDTKQSKSLHGLCRSLVANMIEGVANGYKKDLTIEGVGYKGEMKGNKLVIAAGLAHEIEYVAPDGVELSVKGNTISVAGIDKQQVGDSAARIRSFRPPEPYKGKGIRYKGERVRRKAGKTVA